MKRLTDDNGLCVDCDRIGSCKRDCNIKQMYNKLKQYEDMEERLVETYGNCDDILGLAIELLIKHASDIDIGKPIKARLLTDETADQWERWKKANEEGRLMEFPCEIGVSEAKQKIIGKYTTEAKIFVLISVINRNIDIKSFVTIEEAKKEMKSRFFNMDEVEECLEAGAAFLGETSAWYNGDGGDLQCDWNICQLFGH